MFEFIQTLSDIIVTIIGFVVNAFQMLITFFTTVPRTLGYIIACIGYLPPYVLSVVVVSIGVAVVLMIVNHGQN